MAFTVACNLNCITLPPRSQSTNCAPLQFRNGGFNRLVYASCDVPDLATLTENEICAFIVAGKITVSEEGMGAIPEASAIKKKGSSCREEEVTNYQRTATFDQYKLPDDYSDFDIYEELKQNQERYQFGIIDCNNMFIGWIPNAVFESKYVVDPDQKDSSYWKCIVSWISKAEIKPIQITGLTQNIINLCSVSAGTCGQIQTDSPGENVSFIQDGSAQTFTLSVHGLGTGVVTGVSTGNVLLDSYITSTDFSIPGVVQVTFTIPVAVGGSTTAYTLSVTTDCAGTLELPFIVTLEDPATSSFTIVSGDLANVDGNIPTLEVDLGATLSVTNAVTILRGSLPFIGEVNFVLVDIVRVGGTGETAYPSVNITDLDGPSSTVAPATISANFVTELGTWKYVYNVVGTPATYQITFYIKVV
jgi:hypothetical protein